MRVTIKRSLLSIILLGFFVFSLNAANSSKVVRVGYVESPGFSEGSSDSVPKRGYAYEYLQKLASLTGWKYQYVYGEWGILFSKLQNGEIDLFTQIAYTEDRAGTILFSSEPMGLECYTLFISNKNPKRINIDKYETLNGKKIGIIQNSVAVPCLEEFIKENNLDVELVFLNGEESVTQNLLWDNIDAAVLLDSCMVPDITPMCTIGQGSYFFGVSKERPDILEDLQTAQKKILRENLYYNESLQHKYFDTSTTKVTLDATESGWLLGHQRMKVGYIDNYLPYCAKGDNDELTGIFRLLLDKIAQAYKIEFTYIPYDSISDLNEALSLRKIDILLPAYEDIYLAERNNILITNNVATSQMSIIYKGEYNEKTFSKFAITNKLPNQRQFIESTYPNAEIINYSNFRQTLKAITTGEATCTTINNFVMDNYRRKYPLLSKFNTSEVYKTNGVCMAVNRDSTQLLSILNKGINLTDQSELSEALVKYSQISSGIKFVSFVKSHIPLCIFIVLVLTILIVIGVKFLKKILLENKNSRYDTLTGLLNRKTMNTYMADAIKAAIDDDKPFSLIMYDIDNFKKFNDTYGHDCGDLVLKTVAGVLSNSVRPYDHVFRWGGEEMLVLLSAANSEIATMVADRIRGQVEKKGIFYNKQELHITVTGGVATYRPGLSLQDLISTADKNLYTGKNNGKNQVVSS